MFPKLKPKKVDDETDLTKINKTDFCNDHCSDLIAKNEIQICIKYLPTEKPKDTDSKKVVYTADGVFSYYKNFVYKFLEIIEYQVK
jgi:hypothetical protein